jgi:Tol biopolymer transport system component
MHKRPGIVAAALVGLVALAAAPAGAQERAQGQDQPRFAESARAVANGAYVPYFQVATVRAGGQDNYLVDEPYGSNDPAWNPSGSRIYYNTFDGTIDVIRWVSPDGGTPTTLDLGCSADPDCLGDGHPAISPNGRHLLTERAFLPINPDGNASNASIWRIKIDGSDATQITVPGTGAEDHAPAWSPDGRHFAFSRLFYDTGMWTIYIAKSDGSDLHALTAPDFDAGDPDWSPDGKSIVFQSPAEPADPSTPMQIFKVRPDGTHLVQLTHYAPDPSLTIKTFRARWSPDGERIAFTHVDPTTTKGPDGIPHGDIFIMKPNGSDVVQATHTQEAENGAAWDPRGCHERVELDTE